MSTLAEVFTRPPASRSLVKQQDPLTLAPQHPEGYREPEPVWGPPAPSAPQVLALLDFPHDPVTGMPVAPRRPFGQQPALPPGSTDEQGAAWAAHWARKLQEFEEADQGYFARFKFWAALDANLKTQLRADVQGRKATGIPWAVTAPHSPLMVPLVIRAQTAPEADRLYREWCGILEPDPRDPKARRLELDVRAYREPEPAEGGRPALPGEATPTSVS
jgi:hypothetical protein